VHKKARSLRVFLFYLDHMMRDEIQTKYTAATLLAGCYPLCRRDRQQIQTRKFLQK